MSKEVWTLVGVVIGALLAGGGQILAGALQRRHERENISREHQRAVYVDWMQSLDSMDSVLTEYDDWALMRADYETHEERVQDDPRAVWSLLKSFFRLVAWRRRFDKRHDVGAMFEGTRPTLAALRLVAPSDTYRSARDAARKSGPLILTRERAARAEAHKEFEEAKNQFVRLAKRDLGIDP